jgi:hypothetical protein
VMIIPYLQVQIGSSPFRCDAQEIVNIHEEFSRGSSLA